jgi:hypothetical protein
MVDYGFFFKKNLQLSIKKIRNGNGGDDTRGYWRGKENSSRV